MKTREEVIDAIRAGRETQCLDGRDYARLTDFFPVDLWPVFGIRLKEGVIPPAVVDWTEENILRHLKEDVTFGFEKALNKRGISAGLMYEVVKTWLWVLDDDLQDHDDYPQYGLPLFKAVAVKYGFENPIGDDSGNENKYSAGY